MRISRNSARVPWAEIQSQQESMKKEAVSRPP